MEANARNITNKNKELAGLREEQRKHDEALEAARAAQAKVRTTVMQKEKGIKKAEKTLDGKVRVLNLKEEHSNVACRDQPLLRTKHKSRIQLARSTMQ